VSFRSARRRASRILRSLLSLLSILIFLTPTSVQPAQAGQGPTRVYLPLIQHLGPDALPGMSLLGHIRGGMTYASDVQGSYAAVGAGDTVMLLDVAAPEAPVMVGQSPNLPGQVKDLRWVGSFVYVADYGSGLQVLDVSDPQLPRIVAALPLSGTAWGIDVDRGKAYLALDRGLYVVDVADPLHPVEQGHLGFPDGWALDVKVTGHLAYVAAQWGGLKVVDVSDPLLPGKLGEYVTSPSQASFVDVIGTNVYLSAFDGGLYILDLATPSAPVVVGAFKAAGATANYYGVAAEGRYAYLGISKGAPVPETNGIAVLDLINPSQPVSVTWQSLPERPWRISLAGDHAYVSAAGRGMRVLDLSTPAAAREVAAMESVGTVEKMAVEGSRMLLTESKRGGAVVGYSSLRLMDLSDPTKPRTEAVMKRDLTLGYSSFLPRLVAIEGRYGYTVGEGRLEIWDLDGDGGPFLLSHLADDRLKPSDHKLLAVNKGYIYVCVEENSGASVRVLTIDATQPEAPRVMGTSRSFGYSTSLAVDEDYLYIAGQDGVQVLDLVSTPNPRERGLLPTIGGEIAAGGQRLYGGSAWTLRIADVSDPDAPRLLTGFSDERLLYREALALLDDSVYWGGSRYPERSISAIDVRDPHQPSIIARYELPAAAYQIEAAAGRVYVATVDGLVILAAQ